MQIAYMKDFAVGGGLIFVDYEPALLPEFLWLLDGDLVLTLVDHGVPGLGTHQSWILKALYKVVSYEDIRGDMLQWRSERLLAFGSDQAPQDTQFAIHGKEMLAELGWLPHPEDHPKALPRAAWEWLKEKKGIPLPDLPREQ